MSTELARDAHVAETILRDAPVAMLAYDGTSEACLLASGAVERLVGQRATALASAALGAAAWWKPAAVVDAMRTAIRRGEDITHLQEVVAPSGAVVILSFRLRPVAHAGRVLLVATLEDITHRGADREWRHALERMEAIGRVAGDLAHEFGNLLTVVLSYASLMRDGIGESDPQRADLDEIVAAAERATELAGQFAALRRSRSRGREVIDVGDLVLRQSAFLARLAAPRATVGAEVDAGEHVALADRAEVEQALVSAVLHSKDLVDEGAHIVVSVRRRHDATGRDAVTIEFLLPPTAPAPSRVAEPLEFVHAGPAYAIKYGNGYSLAERVARECGGNFSVRRGEAGAHVVALALPAVSATAA